VTRIALGLQYDGAGFSGWQTQLDRPTVQDELEKALAEFARTRLQTTAAGRTDAGVHAIGQVVHFDTALERPHFAWVRGLNAFLPESVSVQWAKPVPENFHARFAAFERTYTYLLYVHPQRSPLLSGRAGWFYAPLDSEAMGRAAACLVGEHDFSAFRSSECQAKTPVKHLYSVEIKGRGAFIHARFRGNAFLHHMVRNIMGCLVMIGRGRRPAEWLQEVLESRERRLGAPTFMPDGLYLAEVAYPAEFALPRANLASQPWNDVWQA
jgi:tRNA pseudouridine38-40 synthase